MWLSKVGQQLDSFAFCHSTSHCQGTRHRNCQTTQQKTKNTVMLGLSLECYGVSQTLHCTTVCQTTHQFLIPEFHHQDIGICQLLLNCVKIGKVCIFWSQYTSCFSPVMLWKLKCDCYLDYPFLSHWFIIHAMRYSMWLPFRASVLLNHPPTTQSTHKHSQTHVYWRSILKDRYADLIFKTEQYKPVFLLLWRSSFWLSTQHQKATSLAPALG